MFKKIFGFFERHHGLWTAVFTGILTIFTYMLYQVTNATNETSRATQRAFLTFANLGIGAEIHDPSGQWTGQEIAINWSNSGTTPAKAVVLQHNGKPQFEDLPKSYDFPLLPQKTETAIGPKGLFGVNVLVPRSTLEDAWHNKSRLFVWGNALYKDIFPGDQERLSEFCVEITHLTVGYKNPPTPKKGETIPSPVMGNPNASIVTFQWQTCSLGAHNCYDEDCKDYTDRVKDMRQ